MALSATKFYISTDKLAQKVYDFHADTMKMALCTSAAAPLATDTTWTTGTGTGTASETASGNGYTQGGVSLTCTTIGANSGSGTLLKTSANFGSPTWTSSTGNLSFRYLVWWDSTLTSGVSGTLIGFWDNGATTLDGTKGDTFDISGSNFNTSWATVS